MLAIRLQRTGRSGHSQFRMIVQDSRLSPKSGKVVMRLGSYNPHTKIVIVNKEKASFYLEHGAQPSDRVAGLLKSQGVKLPDWVNASTVKKGKIRNPEKLRVNQPAKPVAEVKEPDTSEAEADTLSESPAEESATTGDDKPTDKLEAVVTTTTEKTSAEAEKASSVTDEKPEEKTVAEAKTESGTDSPSKS